MMKTVMNNRMKIAFSCHLLVILSIAIVELIYIFRTEFMPYHAVAVGRNWAEVLDHISIICPSEKVVISIKSEVSRNYYKSSLHLSSLSVDYL